MPTLKSIDKLKNEVTKEFEENFRNYLIEQTELSEITIRTLKNIVAYARGYMLAGFLELEEKMEENKNA